MSQDVIERVQEEEEEEAGKMLGHTGRRVLTTQKVGTGKRKKKHGNVGVLVGRKQGKRKVKHENIEILISRKQLFSHQGIKKGRKAHKSPQITALKCERETSEKIYLQSERGENMGRETSKTRKQIGVLLHQRRHLKRTHTKEW